MRYQRLSNDYALLNLAIDTGVVQSAVYAMPTEQLSQFENQRMRFYKVGEVDQFYDELFSAFTALQKASNGKLDSVFANCSTMSLFQTIKSALERNDADRIPTSFFVFVVDLDF
ncbi:hypothetical protein SPFM14_00094 [Salmonella phage SPFM14]|nr:hypothetical protein SPFM14_00094 [Salmonella phage SPFM14]